MTDYYFFVFTTSSFHLANVFVFYILLLGFRKFLFCQHWIFFIGKETVFHRPVNNKIFILKTHNYTFQFKDFVERTFVSISVSSSFSGNTSLSDGNDCLKMFIILKIQGIRRKNTKLNRVLVVQSIFRQYSYT